MILILPEATYNPVQGGFILQIEAITAQSMLVERTPLLKHLDDLFEALTLRLSRPRDRLLGSCFPFAIDCRYRRND